VHERERTLGRAVHLIAESDLNDVRMVQPTARGGLGMDAQWLDDFHHALHALLTNENAGYYVDYGRIQHMATTLRRGYVFAGDYSSYRKRRHGNDPTGTRAEQFVVCLQNHDQVGNRMLGDRISTQVDDGKQRLGAAVLLLSPYVPLLFMGEEYGARNPFPYFIDHSDPGLVAAVREGRRAEFADFAWQGEPPDPQAETTFAAAKLQPERNERFAYYRRLIELRRQYRLGPGDTEQRDVVELPEHAAIVVLRLGSVLVLSFDEGRRSVPVPFPRGSWTRVFASNAEDDTPVTVTSPGSVCIELAPFSAQLYTETPSA
jgi:maltooligosyltrehalose trehalohydrolase